MSWFLCNGSISPKTKKSSWDTCTSNKLIEAPAIPPHELLHRPQFIMWYLGACRAILLSEAPGDEVYTMGFFFN